MHDTTITRADALRVEELRRRCVEAAPGVESGKAFAVFTREYKRAFGVSPGWTEECHPPEKAARVFRDNAREVLQLPDIEDASPEARRAAAERAARRAEACELRARLLSVSRPALREVGND